MEDKSRWVLITAIAPIAWGSNYYVTREFLPGGHPLFGALLRAAPAGLLLLALCRQLPHGAWWWRSLVLGTLNVGAFFVLIYLAAQHLPTSIAATIMAGSPLVMMLFAWMILGDRPRQAHLAGAGLGIVGVSLLVLTGTAPSDPWGVLASVAAMTMSAAGYALAKRWSGEVDVLAMTSWQLVAGGVVLAPFVVLLEGRPPALDDGAVLGFGYVTVVATALAFAAWFTGLRHLDAGTVGLVGLLNPVTGVLLGTVLAGEVLTLRQLAGMALVLAAIRLGRPRASGEAEPTRRRDPLARRSEAVRVTC